MPMGGTVPGAAPAAAAPEVSPALHQSARPADRCVLAVGSPAASLGPPPCEGCAGPCLRGDHVFVEGN